jgi:Fic family protein
MDITAFSQDSPGQLVPIPEGGVAFVPDPLPPRKFDSREVSLQLADAALALGELKGIGTTLSNPNLLIGPLRRREAIMSSKLEGTFTTVEELVIAEAAQRRQVVGDDTWEVRNYVRALEYGLQRLETLPLSSRLIREVHEKLLAGVRGQDKAPGEFRRLQNLIGKSKDIIQARFVPPPVIDMTRCIGELESYFNSADDKTHMLIRLALIHYQFETVHPFMDGNGRVGRLLIALLMCDRKLLEQPLLYLSPYFEKNDEQYRNHLLSVSQTGAWIEWVQFFLEGVTAQSKDAITRCQYLLRLQDDYRRRIQSPRTSALTLRLVDSLFVSIGTSTRQAAELLGITIAAAQNNINRLVEVGILTEVTGGARDRFYVAREIVDLVNRDKFD